MCLNQLAEVKRKHLQLSKTRDTGQWKIEPDSFMNLIVVSRLLMDIRILMAHSMLSSYGSSTRAIPQVVPFQK